MTKINRSMIIKIKKKIIVVYFINNRDLDDYVYIKDIIIGEKSPFKNHLVAVRGYIFRSFR